MYFSFLAVHAQESLRILRDRYPADSITARSSHYSGLRTEGSAAGKYNPFAVFFDGAMYVYQKGLSEQISAQCTFTPSCSEFSKTLIRNFGLFKGVFLTADRLTRCDGHAGEEYPGSFMDQRTGKVIDEVVLYRWSPSQYTPFSFSEPFIKILRPTQRESIMQKERPFLVHLDSLEAWDEKIAWLQMLEKEHAFDDSLELELAQTYYAINQYAVAASYFASSNLTQDNLSIQREYGLSLLRSNAYTQYLEASKNWSNDSVLTIQKLTASVLAFPGDDSARNALRSAVPVSVRRSNEIKKSPWIAGLSSAVIPGSGKLYCGKKHQFVTSLLANVALGIQTYEAYQKDGGGSARFIVSGILFSFFYVGNIWGSVLAAKNYQYEYDKQFEHEILDYNSVLAVQR